ncbi:hypothetical protein MAA_11820 [Metarhizium robertsii ARSEF 23]|uniref:Uncharacterized protein n=1 Tax=Metarhizium robertsii (strain ARSEF 23 / ATCC MYA-3075) TaxID=655844 RepID=A0A0B2X6Q8_METRA|nr:uncharacterized protein MAA_11820 [Metarhizium robertsii ARSEF 23]KHO10578.1 hypothetical protein MAA_11820 [Metarhizium robertsii ARSEF 23]
MKCAILLVAATKTMGSCLHQSTNQPPPPPPPAAPTAYGCGTKRYCQAIGIFGGSSENFKAKHYRGLLQRARAQAKGGAPLRFGYTADADCAARGMTVDSCGTKMYCEAIGQWGSEDGSLLEDTRWNSTKECLDGHVTEPKDLPWKQPGATSFCSDCGDFSEDTCGAEAFCDILRKNAESSSRHI